MEDRVYPWLDSKQTILFLHRNLMGNPELREWLYFGFVFGVKGDEA